MRYLTFQLFCGCWTRSVLTSGRKKCRELALRWEKFADYGKQSTLSITLRKLNSAGSVELGEDELEALRSIPRDIRRECSEGQQPLRR